MAVPYKGKVLLENGIYRLARRPAVVTGKWYLVVFCKGCGLPIYLLDAPSGSRSSRRPFVGNGKISTPCHRCHRDEYYASHEATTVRAEEDIPSSTPPRVEPSNMPRQKLTSRYPQVKPTFGPGFLEDRPKAAAIVARCIAVWTDVEVQLARLLAKMLRAHTEPAVAMFLTIHNSRIQQAVMEAVAATVLKNDQDMLLFQALMRYTAAMESERHALAHGMFGGSDQIKEGVAWVKTLDHVRFSTTATTSPTGVNEEELAWLRDRTYVYELADLEAIARNMEDLHKQLGFFIGYLHAQHENTDESRLWSAMRYPQLVAHFRIATEIAQILEARRQKTLKEQQAPPP